MPVPWLRFEWDLDKVPTEGGEVAAPFLLRPAKKEELDAVLNVMASAFSMDTGWGDIKDAMAERLRKLAQPAFDRETPSCLVLRHGSRIIGASLLNDDPEAENHLSSGPCILHEYRSRGYGTVLLIASLDALRKAGCKKARGATREKTAAARFVYPKFGGESSPWTLDLEPAPKLAA